MCIGAMDSPTNIFSVRKLRPRKTRRGRGARDRSRTPSCDSESPSENMLKAVACYKTIASPTCSGSTASCGSVASAMEVDETESIPDQEPESFELVKAKPADMEALIRALAKVFTAIIAVTSEGDGLTRFHGVSVAGITIEAYLKRLHKYFDCSDVCLVTSLIYIDRVIKLQPAFPICNRTIHRVLAVGMMLAAKFHDDVFYTNTYYAKVCGLTLKEINALEHEALKLMHWNCVVSLEEYKEYRNRVFARFPK